MPSTSDLIDRTTIVVGASRGLGRGIATAFADNGAPVVAVARTGEAIAALAAACDAIRAEPADASDPSVARDLLTRHAPAVVVLVAGARPPVLPLQQQTWETFSVNWHADVQIAFHWLRQILVDPLRPGSRVIVISSGAALRGSPLSGGYAGAKATERFITAYAQEEATRAKLGISFTTILPQITPMTDLGRPAVEAYAARNGQSVQEYMRRFGEPVTPAGAGAAALQLAQADGIAPAYLLTGAGIRELA